MDDLEKAQEQLGKALERAQAGEDKALANRVREDGEMFVRNLYGMLRMTKIHALDNRAFEEPIAQFEGNLRRLSELLGAIHLVLVEDQAYVNDIRIRFDERGAGAGELGSVLLRHGVGGISFHGKLDITKIKEFVILLAGPPAESAPRSTLQATLNAKGMDSIQLFGVFRFRVAGEAEAVREVNVQQTMDRGEDVVAEAFENLGSNRLPNPLPVRRVVTELLRAGPDAAGLWDDAGGSGSHSAHTVRVARVALSIAEAIGLPEAQLQDLGVAAMLHDVGYAAREGVTATEPGFPPPFERHPAAGARLLLKQRGFHEAKIRRVLAILEHHRNFDDPRGRPSLFARILRIAEDYDNLLRAKVPPALALARMNAQAGRFYDPDLLQALVNTLGKLPPGTLLLLRDGRKVRVCSPVRTVDTWDKPLVRVIADAQGSPVEDEEYADLADGHTAPARILTE